MAADGPAVAGQPIQPVHVNDLYDRPYCFATLTADKSIPNAAFTVVPLDTAEDNAADTGLAAMFDNANDRVFSRKTGLYEVSAIAGFDISSVGMRHLEVIMNGVTRYRLQSMNPTSLANYLSGIKPIRIASGSYLQLYVYQSSGGALNVSSGVTGSHLYIRYLHS